jgi:spore maturation protein CgeB
MRIAFFGSSLLSAYWNGAATYYRGLIRALDARGHRVTFYEPDAYGRQEHRDLEPPSWAEVVVYGGGQGDASRALESARGFDVVVKASGVGMLDEWLEGAVLDLRRPGTLVVFWDVDAPATLDRVERNEDDPFRARIPRYDAVLTYGGGRPVVEAYARLGARRCVPIYNGLDPDTHHPGGKDPRFVGLLGFLGNRLPDREARVDAFFLEAARKLPSEQFVLGGSGWDTRPLPPNVSAVGHVYTRDHNAFNCTPRAVLNITRDSMARMGFSPPTRVFEAAGAGACLLTDAWEGVDQFFEPEEEIIVVKDGAELADRLSGLDPARAARMGAAARRRALADHAYGRRAALVEAVLEGRPPLRAAV